MNAEDKVKHHAHELMFALGELAEEKGLEHSSAITLNIQQRLCVVMNHWLKIKADGAE
jgi:hypothetical protein